VTKLHHVQPPLMLAWMLLAALRLLVVVWSLHVSLRGVLLLHGVPRVLREVHLLRRSVVLLRRMQSILGVRSHHLSLLHHASCHCWVRQFPWQHGTFALEAVLLAGGVATPAAAEWQPEKEAAAAWNCLRRLVAGTDLEGLSHQTGEFLVQDDSLSFRKLIVFEIAVKFTRFACFSECAPSVHKRATNLSFHAAFAAVSLVSSFARPPPSPTWPLITRDIEPGGDCGVVLIRAGGLRPGRAVLRGTPGRVPLFSLRPGGFGGSRVLEQQSLRVRGVWGSSGGRWSDHFAHGVDEVSQVR